VCVCVCVCVYVCVCNRSFVLYIQHVTRRMRVLFALFTYSRRYGLWSRDVCVLDTLPSTSPKDSTFQPLARLSRGAAPYPCHWIKSTVLVYVIANISFRWMSGGSGWVTLLDCALSDVRRQSSAAPQTSRKRKWHVWFTFHMSRDLILAAASLVPRWKGQRHRLSLLLCPRTPQLYRTVNRYIPWELS
jgi:hypothetical protein